jgi:protein TonB
MNWLRLIGLSLALCLHGAVLSALITRIGSGALADGSGSDNLIVVAEVSVENADFLTQRAQEAEIDRAPAQAATPPAPDKQEPEIEPPEKTQTGAPPPQQTANATPAPAKVPPEAPRREPPPEKQQTVSQVATVAAKAQDEQQAAAALAARRDQLWSGYLVGLNLAFDQHKVHVAASGDVLLQFTVAPSGKLLDHTVLQSSGSPKLDRAAITALERAAPFPPLPPELSSGPQTLTAPFRFRTR